MAGYAVANKAATVYAGYLEQDQELKLALLLEAAQRCEEQQKAMPTYANACISTLSRSAATVRASR